MKQVPLRLEDELLERVERARGDVPRERWIRRVIEKELNQLGATEVHKYSDVRADRDEKED